MASLESISRVAEKLHKTNDLGFRFFTVVDGHEVDLVVAIPKTD
jgi:hypothetical protein